MNNKEFLSTPENREIVKSIGRDVIANLDKDELAIFPRIADRLLELTENDEIVQADETSGIEGGFGQVDLLTAIVIPVTVAVLSNLLIKLGEVGIEQLKAAIAKHKEVRDKASALIEATVAEQVTVVVEKVHIKKGRKKQKQIISETVTVCKRALRIDDKPKS